MSDAMSREKTMLVPKLRFPEFRGAELWESKTLAEICLQITNGKANAQDHQEDGDYPLFDRSTVIKKSSEFMFDAEAVILPGEGMRFVPKYFQGKFNLHQRAYALMRHQGDGRFVYQSLDYLQDTLAKKAVKSTVLSLRLPIVQDFVIGCPKPAEQQKIADCLSSLDELIAAQARKVDALKTHKKGLMQQLFPREGETQPRLRFPEFQNTGEWKRRTLGSLCIRIMDGTHFSPKSKAGSRPYLTSKNIKHGWIDLSNLSWISEDEHAEIYSKCPVKPRDVLLTKDGANTGNCAINNLDFEFSLLSSVAVLRANPDKLCQEFLFQSILSDSIQSLITESMSGQAITRITLAKIGGFTISVTSTTEQQRIADCLTSLDTLITAATQELETLKTHKKGLMQQLFPSAEAVEA